METIFIMKNVQQNAMTVQHDTQNILHPQFVCISGVTRMALLQTMPYTCTQNYTSSLHKEVGHSYRFTQTKTHRFMDFDSSV